MAALYGSVESTDLVPSQREWRKPIRTIAACVTLATFLSAAVIKVPAVAPSLFDQLSTGKELTTDQGSEGNEVGASSGGPNSPCVKTNGIIGAQDCEGDDDTTNVTVVGSDARPMPTAEPTPRPTTAPIPAPSPKPTGVPVPAPTPKPSLAPTPVPYPEPTAVPGDPTASPTSVPTVAYITATDGDRTWVKVLEYSTSAWTPTTEASGTLVDSGLPTGFAKLSDDQINSIAGDEYYVKLASDDDEYDVAYMHISGIKYDDTARAMGYSGQTYGLAVAESFDEASFAYSTHCGSRFDTECSASSNDDKRWFADYSGTGQCYSTGSSSTRCFSNGATTGHEMRTYVTMWISSEYTNTIPVSSPTPAPTATVTYVTATDGDKTWVKFLEYGTSAYTPNIGSVSALVGASETPSSFAKLSDETINALAGDEYYIKIMSAADTSKSAYLHVSDGTQYTDDAQAMGYSNENYGLAVASSFDAASFSYGTHCGSRFDTECSATGNDDSRWFADYSGNTQCYSTGSTSARCFSNGAPSGHAMRMYVTMWIASDKTARL